VTENADRSTAIAGMLGLDEHTTSEVPLRRWRA